MISSVATPSVEHGAQSNQADKIDSDENGVTGDDGRSNSRRTRRLMPLKVLNCSLVFPGCGLRLERSQIPALSSSRIFLPRIQPIFTGLEFPDHAASRLTFCPPLADEIACVLVRHLHALGPC